MSKFATEEEIRHAHSILLAGKPFFDDEKIKIIEYNETVDVKACPGSGKTTTLLAKLTILANRMPMPNNQGICVLTHTNVAVDEIKSKLGHKANVLFSYPNFFGTIQSFIDKYIANIALGFYYNSRIETVDDVIANDILLRKFISLDQYRDTLPRYLFSKFVGRYTTITAEEISSIGDLSTLIGQKVIKVSTNKGKMVYDFAMKGYKSANLAKSSLSKSSINKIYEIRREIESRITYDKLEYISNCHIDFVTQKISYKGANPIGFETDSGRQLLELKEDLFMNGTLKYREAYDIALRLCNEHSEIITNAISSRFKYLFVDEMQDTYSFQKNLIENVFYKSIRQYFGDPYQAIYNSVNLSEELWAPETPMSINNSMRFGSNIAEVLKTVCIEDNHQIVGNPSIDSLKPILIVYSDIYKVIPEFAKLIKTRTISGKTILEIANEERNQDQLKRINLKAIGWVGSDNLTAEKITIKSYFPNFNKNVRKRDKVKIDSFRTYMRKRQFSTIKEYSDLIIRSIIHVLSLSETSRNEVNGKLRYYTKTTFLSKLQEDNENLYLQFRASIARWSKKIHTYESLYCDDVILEVKSFIASITEIFSITTSDEIQAFLDNTQEDITSDESSSNNIYADDNVEIEINNIHSVKGETHIATLYMETSYHTKCESERIHEQLKGIAYSGDKTYNQETLKMAYVAMSRPRYMLCMAIHSSHFNFRCAELESRWEIIEI